MINSTVSNNTGGWGGVSADNGFTMLNSTVSGNTGTDGPGGLRIIGGGTIVNSTISNNSGREGAGIWTNQGLEIINSTVFSNVATGTSSQLFHTGKGGGVYFHGDGSATLKNTIVFNNSSTAGSPECFGRITLGGYNLVGVATGCAITPTIGDQANVNAKLGPLQDNGGSTLTHALLPGSPAIDAGNPAGCTDANGQPLTVDQRGFLRPIDGDANGSTICDIGAYEAPTPTLSSIAGHVSDNNGLPIVDVTISDKAGHSVTTDSSGDYVLSGLTPGLYTISAFKSGYACLPESLTVSVPPDAASKDFAIRGQILFHYLWLSARLCQPPVNPLQLHWFCAIEVVRLHRTCG